MNHIYINGEIKPIDQAHISVLDLSYLFGEGAFETFRSYEGRILFAEDHLARLEWTTTFLNIQYDPINIQDIATTLLSKNKIEDARFKLVCSQTQNHGSLESKTNTILFCDPLDTSVLTKPYKVKTIQTYKNDESPLASLKTTNYLTQRLAKKEAQDAGYDDGLLLNHKNYVTETSTGNIFWVDKNGILKTVSKDCLHLPGVMKKQLLKLLQNKQLVCHEAFVTAQELSHSREVFITNSILGIKPVVNIDNRLISGGEAGNITLMLIDLWNKHIQEQLDSISNTNSEGNL